MDLQLPPLAPTRRRLVTVAFSLMESKQLHRWYGEVCHAGTLGEWISDHRWISSRAMCPETLTEIETALVAPLEAAVITHWGVQGVLL